MMINEWLVFRKYFIKSRANNPNNSRSSRFHGAFKNSVILGEANQTSHQATPAPPMKNLRQQRYEHQSDEKNAARTAIS